MSIIKTFAIDLWPIIWRAFYFQLFFVKVRWSFLAAIKVLNFTGYVEDSELNFKAWGFVRHFLFLLKN